MFIPLLMTTHEAFKIQTKEQATLVQLSMSQNDFTIRQGKEQVT